MASSTSSNSFEVPPERALLVIDMKGYSRIPEAKMTPARSDLDDILTTVLAHNALEDPRQHDGTFKDTGDGAILVFPARVLPRLVDPLLSQLNGALIRHERVRPASAATIRLRASLHVGPLSLPDHRGDAINDACRLIDSQAARQALSAAADSGAFLGTVLSETTYRRTVRAGRTPHVGQSHFLEAVARVSDKPDFEEPCWLHVPGLSAQALRPYIDDLPASHPPADNSEAPSTGNAASAGGGPSFQFHAPLYDPTVAGTIENLRIDRRRR
ncbi:hypothetical protein PS467_41725 [Streptomyces luomodiensis]|uniref:Guanylate cyclase domain-containing protein n=1 Tax=Streptomyces luomodiensis TaxID=3026192 RepID=A0ABY9VBL2_9ACTN|nr:hypothetical protein [Streptomyces sp. SCA4-21]WNF01386.1 hypothetical protein PS467_41725 [Streptomyces sp. SCA4-21]